MGKEKTNILEQVDPGRREFLKTLLAGTAFAAPVIATFSIDALTAESAYAQAICNATANVTCNATCAADFGYVGPNFFNVHVSGSPGLIGVIPPLFTNKVNGEVTLSLNIVGQTVTSISGHIKTVNGVVVQGVDILLGGNVATQGIALSGNSFTIKTANLNTGVVCDLDELCDLMASFNAFLRLSGMFEGFVRLLLEGLIVPVPNDQQN